jgi:hypothetical protein
MQSVPVTTYLIQFCPTPQRQERLNVGLVTVGSVSNELRLQFDPRSGARAAALWPMPWVSEAVKGQCGALASRLQALRASVSDAATLNEEVEMLGRRLANELVMVGPRERMMPDNDDAFAALYREWVEPLPKLKRDHVPRLDQRLKRLFNERSIRDLVEANVEREFSFLGSQRTQRFQFAYLNGSENLLLPKHFDGHGQVFDQKLAWARTLAEAVRQPVAGRQPAMLAIYADFETEEDEFTVRRALPAHIAHVWVAGRDDDALEEHVRVAHEQHH